MRLSASLATCGWLYPQTQSAVRYAVARLSSWHSIHCLVFHQHFNLKWWRRNTPVCDNVWLKIQHVLCCSHVLKNLSSPLPPGDACILGQWVHLYASPLAAQEGIANDLTAAEHLSDGSGAELAIEEEERLAVELQWGNDLCRLPAYKVSRTQ